MCVALNRQKAGSMIAWPLTPTSTFLLNLLLLFLAWPPHQTHGRYSHVCPTHLLLCMARIRQKCFLLPPPAAAFLGGASRPTHLGEEDSLQAGLPAEIPPSQKTGCTSGFSFWEARRGIVDACADIYQLPPMDLCQCWVSNWDSGHWILDG